MRQRRVKDIDEKLAALGHHIVEDPVSQKGRWAQLWQDVKSDIKPDLFLELGCGKGKFLTEKAQAFPTQRFIGVEGHTSVVLRALEKTENYGLQNIRFVASYVENILDWFEPEELTGIYLNFSDPWPKERHAKRRLTHGDRLMGYLKALKPGGFIEFKTDNEALFEFTLDEIEGLNLTVEALTFNLHHSPYHDKNTTTEYEQKFSSRGKPIHYVKIGKEPKKMSQYILAQQNGRVIPKEDKIFALNGRAKALAKEIGQDKVINATIGSLLDDEGKLMVLSSVVEVLKALDSEDYADYAPIGGTPAFKKAIMKAAFGPYRISANVEVCATPGGTGAIRNTISNYSAIGDKVLTSDWFWAPYGTIAQEIGRSIATYELFDENNNFNIGSFRSKVLELVKDQGSLVILLNTPAHNPTGYSLSNEDWDKVVSCLKEASPLGNVTLFVDVAYIDFAGEEGEARAFLPKLQNLPENILPIIGFSLSKTFTMYGMRSGAAICLAATPEIAAEFKLVNEFSSRGSWSNSNKAGQVLMGKVYEKPELLSRVNQEREGFRNMLAARGNAFEEAVVAAGLPCVPYDSGFFACIPCPNPVEISEKLEAKGVFVVPLGKGIRISVASISEDICRKLPVIIAEVMK